MSTLPATLPAIGTTDHAKLVTALTPAQLRGDDPAVLAAIAAGVDIDVAFGGRVVTILSLCLPATPDTLALATADLNA